MASWRRQHSVQILLPLARPDRRPVERAEFDALKAELAARYGGVTAYVQAPAEGLWRSGGTVEQDQIVVLEVMVDELDTVFWSAFQQRLEHRFQQREVVVRAQAIDRLEPAEPIAPAPGRVDQ